MTSGEWSRAFDLLREEDQANPLTDADAITMLAQSAYLAGQMEAATQAYQRLHRLALDSGDADAAAAAAAHISFILVRIGAT